MPAGGCGGRAPGPGAAAAPGPAPAPRRVSASGPASAPGLASASVSRCPRRPPENFPTVKIVSTTTRDGIPATAKIGMPPVGPAQRKPQASSTVTPIVRRPPTGISPRPDECDSHPAITGSVSHSSGAAWFVALPDPPWNRTYNLKRASTSDHRGACHRPCLTSRGGNHGGRLAACRRMRETGAFRAPAAGGRRNQKIARCLAPWRGPNIAQ
jgi:hypothetical protein